MYRAAVLELAPPEGLDLADLEARLSLSLEPDSGWNYLDTEAAESLAMKARAVTAAKPGSIRSPNG